MKTYVRTQISLPKELKRDINQLARQRGLSLSGYLRQAAQAYQNQLTQEHKLRAKIATELNGISKLNSGWGDPRQVREWIRTERKHADDRIGRH